MRAVIPVSSVPGWPTPPNGIFAACEAALQAAGFAATVSITPDGILVSDAATAAAFFSSYAGSAAQLAFNQTAALNSLSTIYAGKFASGFVLNGKTFQIDPGSISNITSMAALAISVLNNTPGAAPWPANFFWIAADNSQVPMTAAQMYAFSQAASAYVSGLILNNFALKQAIGAATTLATLQAINLTSGWPSSA